MRTYFKDIFSGVATTLIAMRITFRHLFTPAVTVQYPTVKWNLPDRARARLFNKIEDCIGCGQCARVCPTDCIDIETEKRAKDEPEIFASDGTPIKLRTYVFDIDMTKCCYCALCTFPCPTYCLVMTKNTSIRSTTRRIIFIISRWISLSIPSRSKNTPPLKRDEERGVDFKGRGTRSTVSERRSKLRQARRAGRPYALKNV
jgi:NADH-quinone oxidoreductase subunit I